MNKRNTKIMLFRLLLILILIAIDFLGNRYIDLIREESLKPHTFAFELPIPQDVLDTHGIEDAPDIAYVLIAGNFNGWVSDNPAYMMDKVADDRWEITLKVNPGKNSYKYVIYFAQSNRTEFSEYHYSEAIWAQDLNANELVDDTYGGFNSVYTVRSTKTPQFVFTFVVIGAIIIVIVYTVMEFAVGLLMHARISLKFKLLIIMVILLIFSNLFFLFFTYNRKVDCTITTQIDKINMIHNLLLSEDIPFDELDDPEVQIRITNILADFLEPTALRQSYNVFANNKHQIGRIAVLDTNGQLLSYALEPSQRGYFLFWFGEDWELFQQYLAAQTMNLFQQYTNHKTLRTELFSGYENDLIPEEYFEYLSEESYQTYEKNSAFFRHDNFIYPIYYNLQLAGYYYFYENAESFSELLGQYVTLNVIIIVILSVFYFLLISQVGNVILQPLHRLIDGIEKIQEGDFNYQITVRTQDEIEKLGNSYNFMREYLAYSKSKVDHYTQHLEEVVEERTHELSKKQREIELDLKQASKIQKTILTGRAALDQLEDFEIDVQYLPMNGKVSGDYYSIYALKNGAVSFIIADTSGHGIQAALTTMQLDLLIRESRDLIVPDKRLKYINQTFLKELKSQNFCTAFIINVHHNTLVYSDAGHSPQVLLRTKQKKLELLKNEGKPIGLPTDRFYQIDSVEVESGDILLMFTDGITEEFSAAGEEFGEERLMSILFDLLEKGLEKKSVAEINRELLHHSEAFRGDMPVNDDITMICVRIK